LNQGRPEPDKAGRLARSPATDGPATGCKLRLYMANGSRDCVTAVRSLCAVRRAAALVACTGRFYDFGGDGTERGRVWGKLLWNVLLFLRAAFHFSADRLIIHSFFFSIPVGTIVFPFAAIVHYPARKAIRQKHNISGSDCDDCLTVWCCMCCALVQVDCLPTFNTLFFPDDDCLDRSTASSTRSIP
jgi:Cys-rich protein (TIGR01571 family)